MPTNNTIVPGQVSNFTGTPIDASGAADPTGLQAGTVTQYASSDPLVALTPSADGTNVNVLADPSDTNTSFVLTLSGTNSAGAAISTPFTIAIQAATPPADPAVGFSLVQNS